MRPLAVGEILDGAMAVLRAHPGPALGLSAIVLAVQMALTLPLSFLTQNLTFSLFSTASVFREGTSIGGMLLAWSVSAVIAAACGGTVSAITAIVIGDASLGREITARTVWRQVRPRIWAVVGISLILGIASGVGLLLAIFGWLFIMGVWSLAVPAMMLERAGVFTALKRSWQLSITSFWRVLGIRLLAWGIAFVLSGVLGGLFTFAGSLVMSGSTDPEKWVIFAGVFLNGLGEMSAGVIVVPFIGCVEALLYVDRRMRAEGLDIEIGHRARTTARSA
jgi:hypothetical protein